MIGQHLDRVANADANGKPTLSVGDVAKELSRMLKKYATGNTENTAEGRLYPYIEICEGELLEVCTNLSQLACERSNATGGAIDE